MFNSTICGKCYNTQEFYGRYVPACPRCGYPELKDSGEEYCKSMGVDPTPNKDK